MVCWRKAMRLKRQSILTYQSYDDRWLKNILITQNDHSKCQRKSIRLHQIYQERVEVYTVSRLKHQLPTYTYMYVHVTWLRHLRKTKQGNTNQKRTHEIHHSRLCVLSPSYRGKSWQSILNTKETCRTMHVQSQICYNDSEATFATCTFYQQEDHGLVLSIYVASPEL